MRNRLHLLALVLIVCSLASAARAIDIGKRISIHGYAESQFRMLAANYHPDNAVLSQWMNVLNLEFEGDIAPGGIGPLDSLSVFSRVLVRYDCVYNGCGMVPSWRYWGDRASSAPRNLTTGRTNPYNGSLLIPGERSERIERGNALVDFFVIPPFDALRNLGATNLDATFAPIGDARFAIKDIDSSIGNGVFPLGPWRPSSKIDPTGSLSIVPNRTSALPLRPEVPDVGAGFDPHGLFIPSLPFTEDHGDLQNFEQNYNQNELAWHHTSSQDENELKELYFDSELLDGRVWLRVGKQQIVWGKTELFRTTDQFNPQTLALSSLPSLEESRIALWSVRATYSFYDVGPLEDVRLEVAANLDDFEPLELGRCGQPYTIWLVCGKTFGLWSHGFAGIGLAGERHPPAFWESTQGLEFGARLEFRWDRFSFQVSDFWGYDDAPTVDTFYEYGRNIDTTTGQPLDVNGNPMLPTDSADSILRLHPSNRQLFDVICSATLGVAASVSPSLAENCLLDVVNSQAELEAVQPFNITPATALSVALTGNQIGRFVAGALANGPTLPPGSMVELNKDPGDGIGGGFFGFQGLGAYLTDQQEGLLGCGPFYGTDCDVDGVDLFNAEASVLIQAFPQFEIGGPVATRFTNGQSVTIPGARGPTNPLYDPLVDGCTSVADNPLCADSNGGLGARTLINPTTGERFSNELGAASYNFMILLASLGAGGGNDPGCDVSDPFTCQFVRGVFGIAGARRPDVRAGGNGKFGRRDFIWAGGSELQFRYEKRNVLGLATDFAHDGTGTNWSFEGTWINGQAFPIASEQRGWGKRDSFNLTVSVDRPTFINFLNQNRTFFFNAQVFMRYIDDYEGGGEFGVHGPFSALSTLSAFTGYFQDRLLPALTWVHDYASVSGGVVAQITYRFSQDFSTTIGMATFYGDPDERALAQSPAVLTNQGGDYKADLRYDGLSAIAERDEVFLSIRYTF